MPEHDRAIFPSARIWPSLLILTVAVLAVYWNSLTVPFLFDDRPSILANPSITSLWPPWAALSPPGGSGITVSGRPILNLSFALNYAVAGKTSVWIYHATNLAIHLMAAWVLFGLVRRTLSLPTFSDRLRSSALPIALSSALLWSLHPLQTESVTYIAQRAESLAALWYLLTLYGFLRTVESPAPAGWYVVSLLACLLGMATKETLITAPILVLFFDRTFLSGSLRKASSGRRLYYVALFATWGVLVWSILQTSNRGGTAGLGLHEYWWPYGLTQCQAVMHYLALAFWPSPLVFDYGEHLVVNPSSVALPALGLLFLLTASALALWKRPPIGFAMFSFFLILAPTSSIVPILVQTAAEHRVYLALAGPTTLLVASLFAWGGRIAFPFIGLLAVTLGAMTISRNQDFQSEISIWNDTVAKKSDNARAHSNLSEALARAGKIAEAEQHAREAVRLEPSSAVAHHNLGLILAKSGRRAEAYGYFQEALKLQPTYSEAWCDLGSTLLVEGELSEAVRCFQQSLQSNPGNAEAHNNLGIALAHHGDRSGALREFQQTLRLNPGHLGAAQNLQALLTGTNTK